MSEDTAKKMKRQPAEQEKRFVDHKSDKGLVFRITELLQLSYKQVTLLKEPWLGGLVGWSIVLCNERLQVLSMVEVHMRSN